MKTSTRQRIGKHGAFTLITGAGAFFFGAILMQAAEDIGWTWALVCVFGPLAFIGLFLLFLGMWLSDDD